MLLTGALAPTWSRLHAGRIGVRHARVVVDLLGDATAEVAAAVQERVTRPPGWAPDPEPDPPWPDPGQDASRTTGRSEG